MLTFEGAAVYLPGEIAETSVTIDGGEIVEIGGPLQGDVIDARGLVLAPALIDVHGDAFERQLMPRPGVFFPSTRPFWTLTGNWPRMALRRPTIPSRSATSRVCAVSRRRAN